MVNVALNRSSTAEQFSRKSLPPGWNSAIWNSGGSAVFSLGFAKLNGSRIYTSNSFTQGSIVEFSARFSAGNFENIGFAAMEILNLTGSSLEEVMQEH
jgi:hypothetical protein